jgi:hypothetical protein
LAQTTSDEPQNQSKPTLHALNPNKQTKSLVNDDKHNPQVKMHVLNWHNQNPNIHTTEKLKVLP